jgi:KaiC/GvpD/RAD55 family RecA-like ATPase
MIVNIAKTLETLNDIRTGKIKEGLKLGIEEIDTYFRFKKGFTVVLGHANTGKTQTMLYLMFLYTLKHKIKWLIFSSENQPYSLYRKLIEFDTGLPINKIPEAELRKRLIKISQYFQLIDPSELYTYKTLLSEAKEIKKKYNYDGFLVDPYNSLVTDVGAAKLGKHEYDYLATTEFRQFCTENDCALWLNTHANTEALRKTHTASHPYAGHPIPPNAADVEGGSKYVNRSDNFICIHRYLSHPTDWMYSHIHIKKIKDIDTGGKPTMMDEPIKLRSVKNNVGYEIEGRNLVQHIKQSLTN